MKKLLSLLMSLLMVFSYLPLSAAGKASGANELTKKFNRYFTYALTAEDEALISADDQTPEGVVVMEAQEQQKAQNDERKKSEPQEDLETYFSEYEQVSSLGQMSDISRRQQELAFYIRNSDWHTWKSLSKSDRQFQQDLINVAKFVLSLFNVFGLDAAMDAWEAYEMDHMDESQSAEKTILSVGNDILEASVESEVHAVDALYAKIQHNAFYVLLLDEVDFKKVVKKYPEVHFLLDDLYTYFRWRYELRIREPKYNLTEDDINVKFRTATYINSFLGWWELANVAKSEIAAAVSDTTDETAMRPFTLKSYEEEKRAISQLYKAPARRARYFGRMWNNIQDYAAQKRKMQDISDEEAAALGVESVAKPVRGRKLGVRREVIKALEPLSDKEVYETLLGVRTSYIAMRMRAEQAWKQFMQDKVEPLITEPAPPAWKEQVTEKQAVDRFGSRAWR